MKREKILKVVGYAVIAIILVYFIYTITKNPGYKRVQGGPYRPCREDNTSKNHLVKGIPNIEFTNLSSAPMDVKYKTRSAVIFSNQVGPHERVILGPNACFQGPCDKGPDDPLISVSRYGCNEDGKTDIYVDSSLSGLDVSLIEPDSCNLDMGVTCR